MPIQPTVIWLLGALWLRRRLEFKIKGTVKVLPRNWRRFGELEGIMSTLYDTRASNQTDYAEEKSHDTADQAADSLTFCFAGGRSQSDCGEDDADPREGDVEPVQPSETGKEADDHVAHGDNSPE